MFPKKNILLLIPNLGFGGAQQVFHDHSVELSKHYNVKECVFNKEHGIVYPTDNELIDLEVPGGGNPIKKIYNFYLRCARLRQVKKQYNIDICISHLEGADYVNILSRGREKVVFVIHGSKAHDKEIKGWIGWLQRHVFMPFFYRLPDKIITVSRDIRAELLETLNLKPEKLVAVPNFFYPERILNKAAEPLEPEWEALFAQNQVVITSGRLARQKNQAPLLAIFESLLKIKPAKLALVGDGELREDLVARARALNLRIFRQWENDRVHDDYDIYFLGYQKNPFKFIKRATLFAFPSGWEGFPMALGETMICGLPVVSTDCPTGPREILAPDFMPNYPLKEAEFAPNGILMPLLNADFETSGVKNAWVKTLATLLDDEALRQHYGMKAWHRMQDFTKEKIFEKWDQVITDL